MSFLSRSFIPYFSLSLSSIPFILHLFAYLVRVARDWNGVYCLNEFFTIADRWPLHISHQFLCRCRKFVEKIFWFNGRQKVPKKATNMYLIFIGIWPSGSFKWKCRFMCVIGCVHVFWVYCVYARDFDTKEVLKWSLPFICMNYNITLSHNSNESIS